MKDKLYTYFIKDIRIEIKKIYRTKTQYEYFLCLYYGNSDIETIHLYNNCHLTKKAALNEAKRAILTPPRIEKVFYGELA